MVKLQRPLPGAPITSKFGPRGGVLHAGIDIAAAPLTPIGSAGPGTVTRAAWFNGYGNCVDIDHGGGYSTRYGHMAKILVKQGQTVAAGTTLGLEGATGDATGPHLHFEVRLNGTPQDPLKVLSGEISAGQPATAQNVGILDSGTGALQSLEKAFGIFTSADFWKQLLFSFGGFILVVVGVIFLTGGSIGSIGKAAKKVVK